MRVYDPRGRAAALSFTADHGALIASQRGLERVIRDELESCLRDAFDTIQDDAWVKSPQSPLRVNLADAVQEPLVLLLPSNAVALHLLFDCVAPIGRRLCREGERREDSWEQRECEPIDGEYIYIHTRNLRQSERENE